MAEIKTVPQYESPRPWRITNSPFKIVDANGKDVARLTTLDRANAELIVASVNAEAAVLSANAGKVGDIPSLASESFLKWQDEDGPKSEDQCGAFCAGYFRGNSERPMYPKEDAARRYEILRKLNVTQFQALYKRNIAGEGRFDDLVDSLDTSTQSTYQKNLSIKP